MLICEFLLVINGNWHRTVSELSQLIVQILDTVRFWATLWGLKTITYDVHLGLIGKRVVDFPLVFIEVFSLGVTAESLRAKRDRKSAISLQLGHFDPQFQVEGVAPTNHFCTVNECLTSLPLTVFTQRNFVADFLQAKCDFRRKSAVLRFWDPLSGT